MKDYNSNSIEVLGALEAVRVRPGMYVGSTGSRGLHHILWEIVDNSIDEASNNFANTIDVVLYEDGSVSVQDNGRGIPVDIHPIENVSGLELVFTRLHAGGKFNNENYSYSGGLHGVGASVTNALSRWLSVEVYIKKKAYRMEFESKEIKGKVEAGIIKSPLVCLGSTTKKGTLVHFMPDDRIFDETEFSYDTISRHLHELAFLNKGVKITFTDKLHKKTDGSERFKEFKYDGGLIDFVKYLNEAKEPISDNVIYIEGRQDNFELALAVQYCRYEGEGMVYSYVNNIHTSEGGTHETGFKAAYTKCFNDIIKKRNLVKDKDPKLSGEDFREGMTAVLSVKMQNVQFDGQTKNKLGNPEAKTLTENLVSVLLDEWLDSSKNKAFVETIVKVALGAAKVRKDINAVKELNKAKNSMSNSILVGKFASCTSRKPEDNELFIVEGDSAGGTAKQGRDKRIQAILPLRGKPINSEKKSVKKIIENEEIRTIIHALGAGFDKTFDCTKLKFHKVIILADADQDGEHIRSILLSFFYRYMRPLLTEGHVYLGMPPLYKVEKKGVIKYAYNDYELDKVIEEVGKGYSLQRYKGLGEMNAYQLYDTTMNPDTRTLTRVTLEEDSLFAAERMISTLMGDNIEMRKDFIKENANFNKEDAFLKRLNKV